MGYYKPRIPARKIPDGTSKVVRATCNASLNNQLIDIMEERRSNLSDTVRLLLYLGIEQYHINKATGASTKAKRQEDTAKRKAEAQAIAARREAEKQGKGKTKTTPAVTPLLYGIDIDPEKGNG